MEPSYKHKQFGTVVVVAISLCIIATVPILYISGLHYATYASAMVIGSLLIYLFGSLTVEITEEKLNFWFGPGLINFSYSLADIKGAEVVTNKWYYGFGVRLTPSGWLYNVSGLQAVEVTFASGKKIRLGTDQPEELKKAFNEKIG